MPHIHTKPDQHDMTVSAYVVMLEDGKWKCLVHFHKKIEKLMKVGGHIELNETPWQSMSHELAEESGYALDELEVLQHTVDKVMEDDDVHHPTPFLMNTHNVGNDHLHSDLCYGFVANSRPMNLTAAGESADLRWLTIDELEKEAAKGEALRDVAYIYRFLIDHLNSYARVQTSGYSLGKPTHVNVTYKHGAPGA